MIGEEGKREVRQAVPWGGVFEPHSGVFHVPCCSVLPSSAKGEPYLCQGFELEPKSGNCMQVPYLFTAHVVGFELISDCCGLRSL